MVANTIERWTRRSTGSALKRLPRLARNGFAAILQAIGTTGWNGDMR